MSIDYSIPKDEYCALVAENERLLKAIEAVVEDAKTAIVWMVNAEAKNDKMLELMLHMYTCMGNIDADGNHECFLCEYENANDRCDFKLRLQELGVEVD